MKRSASSPRAQRSPALSIWQPWAWAICRAGKNIENRTWSTRYRGWIALHAGSHYDPYEYARMAARIEKASGMLPPTRWQSEAAAAAALRTPDLGPRTPGGAEQREAQDGRGECPFGAVVAVARIVGVFEPLRGVPQGYRANPWIDTDVPEGKVPYCWVLEDVRVLAVPVPCKGRQMLFDLPGDVAEQVRLQASGYRLQEEKA